MRQIYNFYSVGEIIKRFLKSFSEVLHQYNIEKINKDFKNIFFYFFIKEYNSILADDMDVILIYDRNEKISELEDHFPEFSVYLEKFYKKIEKSFPLVMVVGDKLNGKYLLSDLDISVVEGILGTYKKTVNLKKLKAMLNKQFLRVQEELKIYKFFIFNK